MEAREADMSPTPIYSIRRGDRPRRFERLIDSHLPPSLCLGNPLMLFDTEEKVIVDLGLGLGPSTWGAPTTASVMPVGATHLPGSYITGTSSLTLVL
uniref:Uncharacterized protein n=1 Tax=Oryza sativa subsp. japonica TaxID=39947 RepID=Q654Q1_ORYSJ|nr:hypothetical protein [Oryza sativa Japonica Group]